MMLASLKVIIKKNGKYYENINKYEIRKTFLEIAMISIECPEDQKILKEIEEKIIRKVDLGFNPQILEVLDRVDARREEIEALREALGKGLVTRLFGLGNSTYYGRLRAGKFTDFSEIIFRLGFGPAKIYILSLALFFVKPGKEFVDLAARSFLISFLGKMIAKKMGMTEEEIKKVEMGGLFLKIGKVFMLLYESCEEKKLDEDFISLYYPYIGLKVVDFFKLPEFLKEVISFSSLQLEENSFSISSIIELAHSEVDKSFKKFGKFVIQSPMPDEEGMVLTTLGADLAHQFEAVGLGVFLEVLPTLSPRQKILALRRAQTSNK
jgi:HD-like signal output (HDOD) protein